LHELKRVAGATGQPQAFGFALFVENPEVVLRAMRCLNGVELPDLTPRGRAEGLTKKLIINPDQKTKEFLEEFHKSVPRTEVSVLMKYRLC
jgi:RNA-binding protein 25